MERLITRTIALKDFARMRRVLDGLVAIVERAIARVPKHISTGRRAAQCTGDRTDPQPLPRAAFPA